MFTRGCAGGSFVVETLLRTRSEASCEARGTNAEWWDAAGCLWKPSSLISRMSAIGDYRHKHRKHHQQGDWWVVSAHTELCTTKIRPIDPCAWATVSWVLYESV